MRLFIFVILVGLAIFAAIDYFGYGGRNIEAVGRELEFNIRFDRR